MTNQELYQKKQMLESYLAQITDLEKGFVSEIVITPKNGEAIELIKECFQSVVQNIDDELNNRIRIDNELNERIRAENYPFKEPV